MKKLLSYLGEYKKYVILTPLMMFGESIMEVIIPYLMGVMVDKGIAGGGDAIIKIGIIMFIASFCSFIFGYLGAKFASNAATGFSKNLRQKIFDKVQDFSFNNIDKFSTSSLITRITTDINNIQMSFMMAIRISVRAPLILIGAFVMSVITSPKLSLTFAFSAPALVIFIAITTYFAMPRFKKLLKEIDGLNLNVQENLSGIRVVKSYVRENYENVKFEKTADRMRQMQFMAEKIVALLDPAMQFIIYFSIMIIMYFGGKMTINGEIEVGQIATFFIYTFQILMSLMMLSFVFVMILFSKASADRVLEIIEEEIDIIDEKQNSFDLEDGSIEYKDVNFSYNKDKNNLVLSNINLKISSGETIGIIGSTASGKTTLVQLLPRLYDVLSGEIIVGKHNIKDYDLKTLRDQIAMVLQKNVLFSGTIRENLQWGNENATDNDILTACQNAQASEFIDTLPNGLDTILERGATNLSGGQKQRLCIARALLKNPKILILDDSTSAVDTATDARIRKVFAEKLIGMTKLIIAQRILSIKDADKIIVLDNGKINGIGKHEQLLENNEIYREIYYSQQESLE
ncbi:MAG: ABC transporter ATP-binding protein [Rickettsiales bacterium]|nr:MAG: ABC transporter ATP-binding protein [Rickettsiales bacterium]